MIPNYNLLKRRQPLCQKASSYLQAVKEIFLLLTFPLWCPFFCIFIAVFGIGCALNIKMNIPAEKAISFVLMYVFFALLSLWLFYYCIPDMLIGKTLVPQVILEYFCHNHNSGCI